MMRPQFGSPPAHEVLISSDFATASAASLASCAFAAPFTTTSTTRVIPSPSSTIIRASLRMTWVSVFLKRLYCG